MANYDMGDVESALYHTSLLNQQSPMLDNILKIAKSLSDQYELERKFGTKGSPEKILGNEEPNFLQKILAGKGGIQSRTVMPSAPAISTDPTMAAAEMISPAGLGVGAPASSTEFFKPAVSPTIGTEMGKALLPAVDTTNDQAANLIGLLSTGQATPADLTGLISKSVKVDPLTRQIYAVKLNSLLGGKPGTDADGNPTKIPFTAEDIPTEMAPKELETFKSMLGSKDSLDEMLAKIELTKSQTGKANVESGIKDIELQQKQLTSGLLKAFMPIIEQKINAIVSKMAGAGGLTPEEATRKKVLEEKAKK